MNPAYTIIFTVVLFTILLFIYRRKFIKIDKSEDKSSDDLREFKSDEDKSEKNKKEYILDYKTFDSQTFYDNLFNDVIYSVMHDSTWIYSGDMKFKHGNVDPNLEYMTLDVKYERGFDNIFKITDIILTYKSRKGYSSETIKTNNCPEEFKEYLFKTLMDEKQSEYEIRVKKAEDRISLVRNSLGKGVLRNAKLDDLLDE